MSKFKPVTVWKNSSSTTVPLAGAESFNDEFFLTASGLNFDMRTISTRSKTHYASEIIPHRAKHHKKLANLKDSGGFDQASS